MVTSNVIRFRLCWDVMFVNLTIPSVVGWGGKQTLIQTTSMQSFFLFVNLFDSFRFTLAFAALFYCMFNEWCKVHSSHIPRYVTCAFHVCLFESVFMIMTINQIKILRCVVSQPKLFLIHHAYALHLMKMFFWYAAFYCLCLMRFSHKQRNLMLVCEDMKPYIDSQYRFDRRKL